MDKIRHNVKSFQGGYRIENEAIKILCYTNGKNRGPSTTTTTKIPNKCGTIQYVNFDVMVIEFESNGNSKGPLQM